MKNTAQTDAAVNQGDIVYEESDTVEPVQNNSEEPVTARQELPKEEIDAAESVAVIDRMGKIVYFICRLRLAEKFIKEEIT